MCTLNYGITAISNELSIHIWCHFINFKIPRIPFIIICSYLSIFGWILRYPFLRCWRKLPRLLGHVAADWAWDPTSKYARKTRWWPVRHQRTGSSCMVPAASATRKPEPYPEPCPMCTHEPGQSACRNPGGRSPWNQQIQALKARFQTKRFDCLPALGVIP